MKQTKPFLYLALGFPDGSTAGEFLAGLIDAQDDMPLSPEEPFEVRNSRNGAVYVFDPWSATEDDMERATRLAFDTGIVECGSPNVDVVRILPSLDDAEHRDDWGDDTFNVALFVQGRVSVWPKMRQFSRLPLAVRNQLGGKHDAYVAWTYPSGGRLNPVRGEWPRGMCSRDSGLCASKAANGVMFSRYVLVDRYGRPTILRTQTMTIEARWRDADSEQDDAFHFTSNRFTVDMPAGMREFFHPPVDSMPRRFREAMGLAVDGYTSRCKTRGLGLFPRVITGERGRRPA